MRQGHKDAALSLLQRGRALKGVGKHGGWRVQLMNLARARKRQQRLQAAAVAAERQRQQAQSKVKLDAKAAGDMVSACARSALQ
jgi:hypothetical protein